MPIWAYLIVALAVGAGAAAAAWWWYRPLEKVDVSMDSDWWSPKQ